MTRVNVYVITYNNEERINENIEGFFSSIEKYKDNPDWTFNYHIINNHSNFKILPRNQYKPITVFHNSLRLDANCGHLSRDYNAAIMHGFKELPNPNCEWVVHVHDDSMWKPEWVNSLNTIFQTHTFYSGDAGCSFCAYKIDAVRKIGLWDERFCNIGLHEADYFLRALIYNREHSCINDHYGRRLLNESAELMFDQAPKNGQKQEHINGSYPYHNLTLAMFREKWGCEPEGWKETGVFDNPPQISLIRNYMYYPYFEKHVENYKFKNYLIPAGDI